MITFDAACEAVEHRLDELYEDWDQNPALLGYGFDAGERGWAPLIDWDGVFGPYLYLVDKRTGALTPMNFGEFDSLPEDLPRVGPWPPDAEE